MAYRNLSVTLTADTAPYIAKLTEAGTATRAFGTEAEQTGRQAQVGFDASAKGAAAAAVAADALAAAEARAAAAADANVAKKVASNAALQQQAAAYKAISDAAVAGSDRQIAADRLLEIANKKLAASNLEVVESSSLMASAGEKLGSIFEQIGLRVERSHGLVGAAIKGMASDASAMATGVGTAVGVVGAAFAGFALEGVKHFQELAGEVRQFQRLTGAGAEDASRLVYAMHELGIEPDAAAKAIGFLNRNLVDHADKVAAAGVTVAHFRNGQIDTAQTLLNLGDAYKAAGGGAEGYAIAASLAGKGVQSILPLLAKTREEIQGLFNDAPKHGLVNTQQDEDNAKALSLATRDLHASFTGLEIQLGKGLVPVLTDVASGLSGLIDDANRLTAPIGGVAGAIHDLAVVGLDTLPFFNVFKDHTSDSNLQLHGWAGTIEDIASRALPPLGIALDLLGHKTQDHAKLTQEQALNMAALKGEFAQYGETLDETELTTGKLSESTTKMAAEMQRHEKAIQTSADSVGLSIQVLAANIGYSGQIGVDAFAAQEQAANKFATAVTSAESAASAAFMKSFDIVSNFSASSIAADDKRAASSTKAANTMANDDTRVADAIQHVADLQEQYSDKAASDRQAYADKVAQADQAMTDADQAYADTVESSNQRVRDADQKLADDRISMAQTVADAEARLVDDRQAGQQSVHDAQQRLSDLQRRQAVANNPAASKALNDQIALRDARAAVTKAQEAAAKKEESDLDAITKAKQNQIKTLAKDQEAADKARTEGAKAVKKAEDAVTKAREAQNKLAAEASKIGVETVQQQREMQRAVEAVTKAQQAQAQAAATATGSVAKAVSLTEGEVRKFYDDAVTQADTFQANIQKAIKMGYNPQTISELLKEGATEAKPLLDLMVSQSDSSFAEMINNATTKMGRYDFQIRELARLSTVAAKSSTDDMNRDLSNAMTIMEANSGEGGKKTAAALARELGLGVEDVERITAEFGIKLAAGINPVLQGVGAPTIDARPNMRGTNPATGDPFGAATGGPVPGYGTGDIVPAMLTPGEFVIRKPAVDAIGLDNLHALNAQGFATGGFVSAGDVPMPPDLSRYGTAVGYAGTKADRYEYDKVIAYLAGRHAATGGSASGNGYGYQALIDYLNATGTPNTVTSTTGGGHVEGSLHYRGLAADFVSDNMQAIFDQFLKVTPSMQELFYDPAGYSLKNGQRVDWTVGGHSDHVHAGSWANASEGPGLPTGGPGDKGGSYKGGGQLDDWIAEALHLGGKPESWHKGIYARAMQESSGDPNAINNWDSNAAAGHPTQGIMQMRDDTFARWALPGHTDIRNPVDNIASADNYIGADYGDPYHLPAGGYARGGPVHYAGIMDQGALVPPGPFLGFNTTGAYENLRPVTYGTGVREPVGTGAAIDYNRLAAALRDSIPVALYIDGQEFARSTAPAMSREFLNIHRARS